MVAASVAASSYKPPLLPREQEGRVVAVEVMLLQAWTAATPAVAASTVAAIHGPRNALRVTKNAVAAGLQERTGAIIEALTVVAMVVVVLQG